MGTYMNILFCGTNLPEEWETKLKYLSLAGNRFQNNLVQAFQKGGNVIKNLTFLGIPIEDNLAQKVLEACDSEEFSCFLKSMGTKAAVLGYRKQLKHCLQKNDSSEAVIAYNVVYAWLGLPKLAKKNNKKSVLILADYSGTESCQGFARKLYAKCMLRDMRKYDLVVGLSENIGKRLNQKQRFLCMEGGIDLSLYQNMCPLAPEKGEPLGIMYAGVLNEVTGVDLLLEAMKQMDKADIELTITGRGELESRIQEAAACDSRIRFYGSLPYEQYLEKLKNAHILINPRNMELPENQNNFPSKIMEYLAVGKVLVSTKYAGWQKFDKTAYFCDSNVDSISKMTELAVKEYEQVYKDVFQYNREFAKQFAWECQAERILEELNSI